ncbi:MAG: carbohydrate-binding domain-containing protein [Bacteroidaceae bacterium]
MRKIFLIFLLIVLPCLCVFADTKEQGIVVYTATGSDTVALSVVSSVTHADGFLFINLTGGEKKSYALSSVEWWRIGEVSSLSGQGEGNGSGGNEDDDTVTNRYDVNGDGTVNSADVVCVYNYIIVGELSGLTSSQTDLNEDGSVNSADVVMLYNYILGGDAEKENIVESETATDAICFVAKSGQQYVMPLAQIEKLTFANADGEVSVNVVRSGVASMLLASDIAEVTYCSVVETVCVSYAGDTAAVVNPFVFDGVSLSVSAADVCVTSTSPDEVEYTLDGESENGSFKIYSDKKFQLTLAGLALTNPSGPVINSQSSKKATIKSKAECVNTLTDGTTYVASEEDQKGCVFSEGQLVFKGGGELYVNGNNKHGICSDDYISVENSHITVKSKSDALHANDSVYVGGGTLDLIPGGDGIDCDGDVVVDGGIINCTNTTAGTKAIKSKQNVTLSGGTLTLNASGTLSNENGDISYTTAVKATGDISVGGGEITINNTADGGKGLSADGNIVVSGGILNVTANGKGGVAENTGSNDEDGPAHFLEEILSKQENDGKKIEKK